MGSLWCCCQRRKISILNDAHAYGKLTPAEPRTLMFPPNAVYAILFGFYIGNAQVLPVFEV